MKTKTEEPYVLKIIASGYPSPLTMPGVGREGTKVTFSGELAILMRDWRHANPREDGNIAGVCADRLREYRHEADGDPAAIDRLIDFFDRCFQAGGYSHMSGRYVE